MSFTALHSMTLNWQTKDVNSVLKISSRLEKQHHTRLAMFYFESFFGKYL